MKKICTGGPYGDCCSSYDVVLDHEYTVKEFVEEILKEKPEEWGEVEITKDLKYSYTKREDYSEYKRGNITKSFEKEETKDRKIIKVIAHGGWSNMDYHIKCK